MAKRYRFLYHGSYAEFLAALHAQAEPLGNWQRLGPYYVIEDAKGIRFGIAPSGHSWGYWFVPTVSEDGERTIFSGPVRLLHEGNVQSAAGRFWEFVGNVFLTVVFLPIILPVRVIRLVKGKDETEKENMEKALRDLMVQRLACEETSGGK